MEKFIERARKFPLEKGMLIIYESNTPSQNIKFHFDKHVITIMTKGHKSVLAEGNRYEFFPGSFLMPETKIIHEVSIPNASFDNPTQCIELEINPSFIKEYYNEIYYSSESYILKKTRGNDTNFFLSNDNRLIDLLARIFECRMLEDSKSNQMLITLMVKELLLLLFQTDALFFLLENTEDSVVDPSIKKSIDHMKNNLDKKILIEDLAGISGLGNTTYFKRFKEVTGSTPVEYLLKLRLNHAKVLIKKNKLPLKEIAFKSGFNSYEYFCSIFKKEEKMKPMEYKKKSTSKTLVFNP